MARVMNSKLAAAMSLRTVAGISERANRFSIAPNWVPVKVLEEGSNGVFVYLAIPKKPFLYSVAVKVAPYNSSFSLVKEKKVLENLIGCSGIIEFIGSEITYNNEGCAFFNLVLEYASGGTLLDLIQNAGNGKLSEKLVRKYLKMILNGLSCIHEYGIVHCDLKPENIFVFPQIDGTTELKISNFGLSRGVVDEEEMNNADYFPTGAALFRGTPVYMSPESVANGDHEPPLDIWSLGCTMIQMVTGKRVWSRCEDIGELMFRVCDVKEKPEIPKNLSDEGKDFLEKCFVFDPRERWTASMLLRHPYLNDDVMAKRGSSYRWWLRFGPPSELNCPLIETPAPSPSMSCLSEELPVSDNGEYGSIEEGGPAPAEKCDEIEAWWTWKETFIIAVFLFLGIVAGVFCFFQM